MYDKVDPDILNGFLDNPYDSIIIVDANGTIQFISSSYENVLSIKIEEAIGKPIIEVIPNSGLLAALKSGKADIGSAINIGKNKFVVSRIPLKRNGEVIGAVAKLMFVHTEKIKELYNKVRNLKSELTHYREELLQTYSSRYSFEDIIGVSKLIQKAKEAAKKSSLADAPVLICGESGTGKELFAHAIHQASRRSQQSFVRVNCSSVPNDLIESELFGYEPGAFTGADKRGKIGKFELAHRGTIFLDEIGDMPKNMQVKLMRVLQEREIERIGGSGTKRINFRVISATNRPLDAMIKRGQFRMDLLYRINMITIDLPALRQIRDDIPLLANRFLLDARRSLNGTAESFSNSALEALKAYKWPGNIRELKNVIERAVIFCRGDQITIEDFPPSLREQSDFVNDDPPDSLPMLKEVLQKTELGVIKKALAVTDNNKRRAAQLLGVDRSGLYYKMKKYNLL